jgi:hypothetical protein
MAKDFNRNQDQRESDERATRAQPDRREPPSGGPPGDTRRVHEDDPQEARSRSGEGFSGAVDEYAQTGFRQAGHRAGDEQEPGAESESPARSAAESGTHKRSTGRARS